MRIIIYGINSRLVSNDEVLRLVSNYEELFGLFAAAFAPLKKRFADIGAAIISTCLRYEILIVTKTADGADGERAEKLILTNLKRYFSKILQKYGIACGGHFHAVGVNALEHLYSVMCGFESEDIGEIQVLGQIKDGYLRCRGALMTSPAVDEIYEAGLKCVAKVRGMVPAFTDLNLIKKSVLKKLNERMGTEEIAKAKALVAGGGLLAAKLRRALEELGASVKSAKLPTEAAGEKIKKYDILVFVNAAIGFRVEGQMLAGARKKIVIFDLSPARCVSPQAAGLETVELITIDELINAKWKDGEKISRRRDIGQFYESARKTVAAAAAKAAADLDFRFENTAAISLMNELAKTIESEFARSAKGLNEKNYLKKYACLKAALVKKIPALIKRRLS